jgi:hypothetical protein
LSGFTLIRSNKGESIFITHQYARSASSVARADSRVIGLP